MRPRTFHPDRGELHGITVVVDTDGPQLFVGRCDQVVDAGVVLHDAAEHRDGDAGLSKVDYLARAAQVGFWKQHDRVVVPASRVVSIRRLADL